MKRGTTRKLFLLLASVGAVALAWAEAEKNPAAEMVAAAQRFLKALKPDQHASAVIPFQNEERQNWHYIPRERRGVAIKQLAPDQREFADALLHTGLSNEGFSKATNIRQLDQVLFDESHDPIRDPDAYFFSIFAEPNDRADWGWRVEGHHLSLNFTLRNGRVVSATPFFFGANPAEVRHGPHTGLRVLAEEEERGRALVRSFNGALRQKVMMDVTAPADIVTGNSRKAQMGAPAGVAMGEMNAEQARQLTTLIEMYAHRLRAELAEMELTKLRKAGFDKIHFTWAGGIEPGQPHYYRIQGPTFVIEYDNTQNNANHIHTVWRDFENDFGLDPLRAHYLTSPHHRNVRLGTTGR